MTINGEPVAEIDIKASFLTIYHAMADSRYRARVIPTPPLQKSIGQSLSCGQQ